RRGRRRAIRTAGTTRATAAPESLRRVLCPVFRDLRALDVNLRARRSLVADHLVRARPAPRRPHKLAVRARGNHHALTRLQHLRRLVDRAEWPLLRARPRVVRLGRTIVHVVRLAESERLLP